MVGLVGLLKKVATLHCNILRHLYCTPDEGKSQLILVKRENAEAKGGRKAHRAYPFTLITTSVSIITSALLSYVHPTVAVLRLNPEFSPGSGRAVEQSKWSKMLMGEHSAFK
jgi:hypothetical protein